MPTKNPELKQVKTGAPLTVTEATAILSIIEGADVYDYGLAGHLRGFQRRGGHVNQLQGKDKKAHVRFSDALFTICDAMNRPDALARQPYFGAKATFTGIEAARAVLKAARAKSGSRRTVKQLVKKSRRR